MTEDQEAPHSARTSKTLTRKQIALLPEIGRYSPLARHACDIAQLLLGTGITTDELARLRWSDVNFEAEILRVIAEDGNVRMVRLGYYEKELLLVWSGPMFSAATRVLGTKPSEVLDEAERRLQRAFSLYEVSEVNFTVIQNTSSQCGFARPAEPEAAEYIM